MSATPKRPGPRQTAACGLQDSSFVRARVESANLDVLRSIAVLLVFACHFSGMLTGGGARYSLIWRIGRLGVLIFFVHTCLVLMWSLDRSQPGARHLFSAFYVRRAFRIYPLSIVFVLFALVFDTRWNPVNLCQSLTLTQYIFFKGHVTIPPLVTPLWSLPLEVEMYVALPCLYLIFRNRSILSLAFFWISTVVLSFFQPRLGEGFEILKYVPCFLGGIMAWRLIRSGARPRLPAWTWPAGIAAASVFALTATEKSLFFSISALGMCLGLLIPQFHELTWPPITRAAKIVARYSYGIYLAHFPIMSYVMQSRYYWPERIFHYLPPMIAIPHFAKPIDFVLVTTLTAVASFVLYHAIEEPGIRLGHRLARKILLAKFPWQNPQTLAASSASQNG